MALNHLVYLLEMVNCNFIGVSVVTATPTQNITVKVAAIASFYDRLITKKHRKYMKITMIATFSGWFYNTAMYLLSTEY